MRKAPAAFAIFVLALILISGCVKETESQLAGKEEISKALQQDLDSDGKPDVFTYVFKPLEVENFTFMRVVVVKPIREPGKAWRQAEAEQAAEEEEQNFTFVYGYNDSELDSVQEKINSFAGQKAGTESECRRILGLDRPDLPCYDKESCLRACYTPICQPFAMGVGQPFIFSMLQFNNGSKLVDQKLMEASTKIEQMRANKENVTKEQYISVLASLHEVIDLSVNVNQNDIFNPNVYFLCKPVEYDLQSMRLAVRAVEAGRKVKGETTPSIPPLLAPATPDYYEYSSYLLINGSDTGDSDYIELRMQDEIPNELGATASGLVLGSNATDVKFNPTVITWRRVGMGVGRANNLLSYSLVTNQSVTGNWLQQNLQKPLVSIRRISLMRSPFVAALIDIANSMFGFFYEMLGYFMALAIVSTLFFIIFVRVIWTALRLAFRFVETVRKRGDIRATLYQFAGHSSEQALVYAGVAVVMLIVGAFLINPSAPSVVQDTKIMLDRLPSNISAEPIRTFGAVVLFLGLVSLYYVAEDYIKGLALGKEYYMSPVAVLREQNSQRIAELERQVAEIQAVAENCKKARIDISDAEELIFEIPVQRIKNAIEAKKEPRSVKSLLDGAFVKADEASARAREKMSSITANWPAWSASIKDTLAKKKTLKPEMLLDIPKNWRDWALERYFSEHSGEGIAFEEGALVAFGAKVKKSNLGDLLKDIVSAGKVDGGAIVTLDGALLAAEMPKGVNKALVSKMASKMMRSASSVASALAMQDRYILSSMAKGKMLARPAGKAVLICLLPATANVAQVLQSTESIATLIKGTLEQ